MTDGATKVGKKEYFIDPDVVSLCERIIDEENIELGDARVKYVLVYPNISKTLAGRCIRSRGELRFLGECEYVVEFSGELWDALDEERQRILALHELMHILVTMNDKTGEWNYGLRRHDVEDFFVILEKYGVNWISEIKTINSSLYDLDPEKTDRFRLG